MSIQINRHLVKAGVAVGSLQANKAVKDNSPRGNGVASKPQVVSADASQANINARFDSYIARGAFGFLAMKL